MADKIVVMQAGVIEQIGSPLELYDRPKNLFVAGFIGSPAMNLMRGTVHLNGGSAVMAGDLKLPVSHTALSDGRPVVYGIRPEHLDLAADGVPAEVTVVEPTGSETMVFLKTAAENMVAVFRERHHLTPGQRVHVRPDPGQIHLFDGETGERLEHGNPGH
jgi:multiple sugar transport system ATP-binding protein